MSEAQAPVSEGNAPQTPTSQAPAQAQQSQSLSIDDPIVAKKLAFFDQIDSEYKQDPNFRKIMDVAISKKFDQIQFVDQKKAAEPEEDFDENDPVYKRLMKKHQELDTKVTEVRNLQAYKDIDGYRSKVGFEYLDQFDSLAQNTGYLPNTPAYQMLYKLAEQSGKEYAKQIGLVNDQGIPDPQLQFNPQLIKKAFELAHRQMEQIGFNVVEDRRKHFSNKAEEKRKQEDARLTEIIKPEKLRTPQDRAAAFERAYKYVVQAKYGV